MTLHRLGKAFAKPEESVKRETAWCMLQAIDGLRQELIKIMDNGKIAQNAIGKSQKNLIWLMVNH